MFRHMAKQRNDGWARLLTVTKALADENRVRTLYALRRRELCVCQITELLRLAPSTVSKHMAILRQSGLVESRKDGRWIYYRRAGTGSDPLVLSALDWLDHAGTGVNEVARDGRALKDILKVSPEALCALKT